MDIKTLLLVQAYIVSIATLFFFVVYRLSFPVRGPGWWVGGFATLTVGLALFALRGVIPDFLSIVVAHLFFFLDYTLFWKGFLLYLHRPGFSRWQCILLGVLLVIHVLGLIWFGAVHDSIFLRTIIQTLVYSAMNWGIALTLLRAVPGSRSIRLTGWLFLLNGFIFWVRTGLHIAITPEQNWWLGLSHAGLSLANIGVIVLASLAMLLLISDALERRLQEQNAELERNLRFREEVEHLLTHDLRRPLVPILHLPDKLAAYLPDQDEARQTLKRIQAAGVRIRNMIDQRLEVLQIEQGHYTLRPGKVDMADLLDQTAEDIASLAAQYSVTVRIVIGDVATEKARPIVYPGDESLIYSMTLNLLANAVEASPKSGEVLIRLEPGPGPVPGLDGLHLSITNDGEVPPEIRDRFAQKYTTAGKPRGRGLGAYSAKLVAEAHGGSLTLDDSIPGQTTIRVNLPWMQAAP